MQSSNQQKYGLPPGPLTTGIVIPLKCNCPPGCVCNEQVLRNWHHKACGCPSFINEFGDIFCKNYKDKQSCTGYFIKDASFQCSAAKKSETWHQFRGAAQFLMAIAQGMQAAEFTLSDNDIVTFGAKLTAEVTKRWYQ